MAKVINTDQGLVHAAIPPASLHSRQVGLELSVLAGLSFEVFEFTPILGSSLRLLGVDLWVNSFVSANDYVAAVAIVKLNSKPTVFNEVFLQGEPIIPNNRTAGQIPLKGVGFASFHWSMNRLYAGEGNRFGCAILNASATVGFRAMVGFQISEG